MERPKGEEKNTKKNRKEKRKTHEVQCHRLFSNSKQKKTRYKVFDKIKPKIPENTDTAYTKLFIYTYI